MPLFGAHMSIAGGLHNALLAAQAQRCDTVQLFTGNPRQLPLPGAGTGANPRRAKGPTDQDIRTFKRILRQSKLRLPMAHDCYLINLASPNPEFYRTSVEAFAVELQRAEALGLRYLVMH